jgi:hypothetical protein
MFRSEKNQHDCSKKGSPTKHIKLVEDLTGDLAGDIIAKKVVLLYQNQPRRKNRRSKKSAIVTNQTLRET